MLYRHSVCPSHEVLCQTVFSMALAGVLQWGDLGLLALWEQGRPYKLDPLTLDTVGESTLHGQLDAKSLGAHYRIVTQPDGSR